MAAVTRTPGWILACVCLSGGLALARQVDPIQIRVSRAVPETLCRPKLLEEMELVEWIIVAK